MQISEITKIKTLEESVFDLLDKIRATPAGETFTVNDNRFEGFRFRNTTRGGLIITDPNGNSTTLTRNQVQNPDRVTRVVNNWNSANRPRIEPNLTGRYSPPSSGTGNRPEIRAPRRDTAEPTPSQNRNPRPSKRSMFGSLKNGVMTVLGFFVNKFGAGTASWLGVILNTGFSILEAEEELDNYLRIVVEEVDAQLEAGVPKEEVQVTPRMTEQYNKCIELMVEAGVKAVAAFFTGTIGVRVAAPAIAGAVTLLVGSGPVGWITALVAGGLLFWYGTEAIYWILEQAGVNDALESAIKSRLPETMEVDGRTVPTFVHFAMAVDEYQMIGDDPTTTGADPDDSGAPEQESINEESEFAGDIEDNLKQIIQSDEKLLQIYRDGKEKLKAEEA